MTWQVFFSFFFFAVLKKNQRIFPPCCIHAVAGLYPSLTTIWICLIGVSELNYNTKSCGLHMLACQAGGKTLGQLFLFNSSFLLYVKGHI